MKDLLPDQALNRIETIVGELALEIHMAEFEERLSASDWTLVRDYVRQEIRSSLEIGVMLQALLELAERRGVATRDVCDRLRHHEGLRTRNFGVADDRDESFMTVALSEKGIGLVETLEKLRQEAQTKLLKDMGMPVRTPAPPGKRLLVGFV